MKAMSIQLYEKIKQFISNLFGGATPFVEKQKVEPQEPVIKRKYNKEKKQDFNQLLEHLDEIVDSLKLPNLKESYLDRDSIIGLKKLGVHIPNPWILHFEKKQDILLDMSKPLPAIMCISSAFKNKDEEEPIKILDEKYVSPKIMFAIKQKKLPHWVQYNTGTPYLFGMAFDWTGGLFWMYMYLTVSKTGAINMCDELKNNITPIVTKTGKQKHTVYAINKKWQPASFLEENLRTVEESKIAAKNIFRAMHTWWVKRDDRWNVIVKKNGERVTFGVENKDTPYYFKDREKVITENGKAKKIVHYVKEHERKTKVGVTTVKEHIRGLTDFKWQSCFCSVVSPKLVQKTSASFVTAGDEDASDGNVIYLSKVGKLLADAEEKDFKYK
jgi:hypothetical protein